ncbi:MAG: hypothetical protein C0404_03965 [Verrucomicrobia bacterium]|nr:hypothetical protein [Verrucomicrobiota bacterium]
MTVAKTNLRGRLKLLYGKSRRLLWNVCRPGYVRSAIEQRKGECRRCGVCCRLIWRCKFYREEHGVSSCTLYNVYRPPNCRSFPIDHRDIRDRDLIAPHIPCGYWWVKGQDKKEKKKKKAHHH